MVEPLPDELVWRDERTPLLHVPAKLDEDLNGHSTGTLTPLILDAPNAVAVSAAEPAAHVTVSWIHVALLFVASSLSLPTIVTGMDIMNDCCHNKNDKDKDKDTASLMGVMVLGNFILAMITSLCGIVGAQTRKHSYHLAQRVFGGGAAAALFIGLFAVSLLGWYMVNLNILVETLGPSSPPNYYSHDSNQKWTALLQGGVSGALMTLTAMMGFQALELLSLVLAPVLALVIVVLVAKACIVGNDLQDYVSTPEVHIEECNCDNNQTPTMGETMSSVVGLNIMGAIISSDYTRFVNHWTGAIWSALLAALVTLMVEIAAGYSSRVFHTNNLADLFVQHAGLPQEALWVLILGGCWIVNAMNLYSLSLSLQVTLCYPWSSRLLESTQQEHSSSSASLNRQPLDLVHRQIIAGVAGFLGTVLATCCSILDHFLVFLFYLSVMFAPVATPS